MCSSSLDIKVDEMKIWSDKLLDGMYNILCGNDLQKSSATNQVDDLKKVRKYYYN